MYVLAYLRQSQVVPVAPAQLSTVPYTLRSVPVCMMNSMAAPNISGAARRCFSHLCLSALLWDTIFLKNLSLCVMCVCVFMCVFMCVCQEHVCHRVHGLEVRGLPLGCQSHPPPWFEIGSPLSCWGSVCTRPMCSRESPISASFFDSEAWGSQMHATSPEHSCLHSKAASPALCVIVQASL